MLALDMLTNHEPKLTNDSFSLTKDEKQVVKVCKEKVVPSHINTNTESQQSEVSSLPPFDHDEHHRTRTVTLHTPHHSSSTTTTTSSSSFDPVLEYFMNEEEKAEVSKHKLLKNTDKREKDNYNSSGNRIARGRCRLCKIVFPNKKSRN